MYQPKKTVFNKQIIKTSAFLFYLLLTSFSVLGQNFYTQNNLNRTAAEWEPAVGTMITYPLCVPYKLAVELAKDNHLYTLVKNEEAKNEAISWYSKWGIDATHNTFITTSQGVDAWWTRDWGPSAVFSPEGKMMLADPKYIYSTPDTKIGCSDSLHFLFVDKDNNIIKTEADDNATLPVGKSLNIPVLDLPFVSTGGNFITDGLGSAFSTCVLLNENNYYKVLQEKFFKLNKKLLGINNYNIISNFEKYGIQHIDCFMKLLDEERILVAEPPKNHELYPIYENIVENELKKLKTAYGRPFKILRLKTGRYSMERLAAYTNSIIVNKTIYVPLFQIKEDSIAIKKWKEVMPGYTVKGFEFALKDEPVVSAEMQQHYKSGYGWNNGDALHCRTRAVWDAEMLFISSRRINEMVNTSNRNLVFTTIIDYSKKGLELEKCGLNWRIKGEENWKTIPLKSSGTKDHYFAEIPFHQSGKTVEYYISAQSKSGRKETQPRTAPLGTYEFRIK